MIYLLDTNVLSELRRGKRADPRLREWIDSTPDTDLATSVLVLGEIRRGVESIRRRDPASADALDVWLRRLTATFRDRVLPIDPFVADQWGRLNVPDPGPTVDGLLAATAIVYGMTLVTRNVKDVAPTPVATFNPFVQT